MDRLRHPMPTTLYWGAALGVVAMLALLLQTPARPPWQGQFPPLPTATITVGDRPLVVETAADPAARARGLGYREGLAADTGMLFVQDEPSIQSFWMKGMRFCLDIVWIEDGEIVGAAENACPDPEGTPDADRQRFLSPEPVRYVLEVPAGWLASYGFGTGAPVADLAEAVAATS